MIAVSQLVKSRQGRKLLRKRLRMKALGKSLMFLNILRR